MGELNRLRAARKWALFVLATAVAFLIGSERAAAVNFGSQPFDQKSNSYAEFHSVFSIIPYTGYLPVRIKIANGTGRDRTVDVKAEASLGYQGTGTYTSTFKVEAPKNSTETHEFLIPLPTQLDLSGHHYGGPQLRIDVTMSGFPTRSERYGGEPIQNWPTIGISQKLAAGGNLNQLNSAYATHASKRGRRYGGGNRFGGEFDPDELSKDWRAYSGFDHILLTRDEYEGLEAGKQSALRQWVRLGGTLDIYSENGQEAPELLSMGQIRYLSPGPDGFDAETVLRKYSSWRSGFIDSLSKEFTSNRSFKLLDALGTKSFGGWMIGIILVLFGIIVGPVNLFVLAGAGKRHRLFFTTPIISIAASLLLIALIFFQDGAGGEGHRRTLVNIVPEDTSAYIYQEQLCRTGVLFGSSFEETGSMFVTHVNLPPSRWTSHNSNSGSKHQYSKEGSTFSGDWFESRREQAHLIQAVQPSRARIEIGGTLGAPVAISALGFEIEGFHYIDENDRCWRHVGKIPPGGRIELTTVPISVMRSAWRSGVGNAAERVSGRLAVSSQPLAGTFFSYATESSGFTYVETLSSIDWEDGAPFIYGPVVSAGTAGVQPQGGAQ